MKSLRSFIEQSEMYGLFEPYLPGDHDRTFSAGEYVQEALSRARGPVRLLDLGCGAGASEAVFTGINPLCQWHGADVAASPEMRAVGRTRGITVFDGTSLPWKDGFFEIVYSQQVLEHVRRPEALLADVARVLRPGGAFAGSASYLEPYHSLSLFNYTPYGLITVLQDAGFAVAELRPGSDCWSVILRQAVGGSPRLSRLLRLASPVEAAVRLAAAFCGLSRRQRNFLKIQFAGHLCFLAYKKT